MAFIDELIRQGGLPYGMEIEQPKAHDAIDSLLAKNIENLPYKEDILGLVMGTAGGRGIKVRNAKAIRDLTSGKLTGQQTLKPQDAEWLKNQMSKWESTRTPQFARREEGSGNMIDKLLPFLLLSLTEGLDMGGKAPNIGKPPKQY